jgi:hypothetical protein
MGVKMRNLADTFKESADAATAGDFAKALECLVWMHDNPDLADPRSEVFRRAHGFFALGVLASVYEPAKTKLVSLVMTKREQVAAGQANDAMQADLRSLEDALRYAKE